MKRLMALALTLMLSALAAQAQQSTTTATASTSRRRAATRTDPAITNQLSELKQAIDAQHQQIIQLSQQIHSRDQQLQQLQQKLDQSQSATAPSKPESKADTAASQSAEQQQTVTSLKSDVADLKSNNTNSALALQETQKLIHDAESPIALHYKGVNITPVGFLAAETVWRQHALGSDINTPFNSISMPGADRAAHLSEFFGSGRQSRVGMLVEGKLSAAKLSGYVEADFLSAGITSNNNQSNSYSLRQRQAWAQAALNDGLTFTGGQMWSLVTETKKGMDNRTEALPMTIDPQYSVGFSWARQFGFRVTKSFSNKFWLGASGRERAGDLFGKRAGSELPPWFGRYQWRSL